MEAEIHSGSRTLEAPRGNRYAPARGLLVMMMIILANNTVASFIKNGKLIPENYDSLYLYIDSLKQFHRKRSTVKSSDLRSHFVGHALSP